MNDGVLVGRLRVLKARLSSVEAMIREVIATGVALTHLETSAIYARP